MAKQYEGDTLSDEIMHLKSLLESKKAEGKLKEDGQLVLEAINSNQWMDEGVGSFIKGLTANVSPMAVGWLRNYFNPEKVKNLAELVKKNPQVLDKLGYEKLQKAEDVDISIGAERAGLKQYAEDYPVRSFMAEMGGGAVGFGKAKAAETLASTIGKGIGYGAVAGAAEADVPLEDIRGKLEAGASNGVLSGIFGGTLFKGGEILKAGVYNPIVNAFSSDVRIGRDTARALLREAVTNDKGSLEEGIQYVLNKVNAGKKEYVLADIGENSVAYLDFANLIPSVGKTQANNFLKERDAGALTRITSDIQETFGSQASFFDTFNALKKAREEASGKLYEEAYKTNINVSGEFNKFLQRPSFKKALSRVKSLAAENDFEVPNFSVSNQGRMVDEKGNIVTDITTEFGDYLKRAIDDQIYQADGRIKQELSPEELKGLLNTREQFVRYLDDQNPAYKAARDQYSGDTRTMFLMTKGQKIDSDLRKDGLDKTIDFIGSLNTSEKEAFRNGIMDNLINKFPGGRKAEYLDDTSYDIMAEFINKGNPAKKLLSDYNYLAMLRKTFPEGGQGESQFKKFLGSLRDEAQMKTTRYIVQGNSATAKRKEVSEMVKNELEANLDDMSNFPQFVSRAIAVATGSTPEAIKSQKNKRLTALNDELTRILTTKFTKENGRIDAAKAFQIQKDIANSDLRTVIRKYAPNLIPDITRAAASPRNVAVQTAGATEPLFGERPVTNIRRSLFEEEQEEVSGVRDMPGSLNSQQQGMLMQ